MSQLPASLRFDAARAKWHEQRGNHASALKAFNDLLVKAKKDTVPNIEVSVDAYLQALLEDGLRGRPGCNRCRYEAAQQRRSQVSRDQQPAAAGQGQGRGRGRGRSASLRGGRTASS